MVDKSDHTISYPFTPFHSSWTNVFLQLLLLTTWMHVFGQEAKYPPQSFSPEPAAGGINAEGSTKILTCRVNSNPAPVYRWLKDDRFITNETSDYTYKVVSLRRQDAGVYRCLASNELGSILSSPAYVEVAYLDSITNQPPYQEIKMNQSSYYVIQLPPINSVPELTITWFRNNSVLNNEGLRNQVTLNQSLVLLGQEMSDSGSLYRASGLNGITGAIVETSIYNVTIIGRDNLPAYMSPEIVVPMKDASVKKGATKISFECIASARPMDNIQTIWYKVNGSSRIPIMNNQDKYILSLIKNRTLTIKDPDTDDAGIYECEVSLMQNDQQMTGTRKAVDKANLFVSVNPLITTQFPSNISKDFGDRVVIPCSAIGPPQPTIHWLFNGLEIQNDSDRYTIDSNGTLTVERLDVRNAGMYQCFARNVAGDAYKSVWLKVNRAPPQLKIPPQNVTVIEGTDTRFPCETTGAPVPVTTWFKVMNDIPVQIKSEGRFQIQYLGELLITTTQPDDSGIYRCIAVNIVGNISAQAFLQVYVKTEINRPQQDLTVIKGRSASLQCGVSHDPQILVTWHWYYDNPSQDDGVFTEIIPDDRRQISSDGTLTINGIFNEDIGIYQCQVQSIGGNDSRTVRLVVIELPQKPAITNVEVHPINQTAAVVSFVPYYDGNSPILHFNVQYMEVTGTAEIDTGSWVTFPFNINPENRSVIVTDLRPARFYQFRVSATNVVGEGISSDPKPTPPLEMPQQGADPPNMLSTYFNTQYVKPGSSAQEKCQASGDPKPTYIWKKDVIVLSTDPFYEINSDTGDIKIKAVTALRGEGTYQCFAQNSQGTALSGFWDVKVAALTGFDQTKTNNPTLNEYSYYSMPCEHQPFSVPASKLDWIVGVGDNTAFPTTPEDKRRIVLDADGTLHFLFVRASDNANNPYRCQLFNDIISIKAVSLERFYLNVQKVPEMTSKPILKYSKSVEGTIGSKAILLCIFAGNPIPDVEWLKDGVRLPDGSSLPDGTPRYKIDPEDSTGRKLIISKLEIKDEGDYICHATNSFGTNEGTVRVIVTGPPQWSRERLGSTLIPVGGTAKFQCDTVSYHATSSLPMWMKNGEPMIGCGMKKLWCGDGTGCYDYRMKCDSRNDCPGISSADEQNCPALDTCGEEQFSCGGGECKPATEVIRCDGTPQCLNGGDESVRHCGCKVNSDFMCADLQKCVSASERCNKHADCTDGSDEKRCAYDPEKVIDNKFHFSADLRQLTIPNVKKTDTMCLQCLVYNFREYGPNPKPDIVGITFGDACLRVLDPINILSGLPDKQKVQLGDIINFTISVQTDPLEQGNLRYDWYIGGKKYPDQFPLDIWLQIIKLSKGNTHLIIDTTTLTSHDDKLFQQLMGNLSMRVYHEFDQRIISMELFTEIIYPQPSTHESLGIPVPGIVGGIVAGFVVILCLVIGIFLWRRYQHAKQNKHVTDNDIKREPEERSQIKSSPVKQDAAGGNVYEGLHFTEVDASQYLELNVTDNDIKREPEERSQIKSSPVKQDAAGGNVYEGLHFTEVDASQYLELNDITLEENRNANIRF